MSISNLQLEQQLLDSDAGRAVYDALIQANIDLRCISPELVKDMLCEHVAGGLGRLDAMRETRATAHAQRRRDHHTDQPCNDQLHVGRRSTSTPSCNRETRGKQRSFEGGILQPVGFAT